MLQSNICSCLAEKTQCLCVRLHCVSARWVGPQHFSGFNVTLAFKVTSRGQGALQRHDAAQGNPGTLLYEITT